MATQARTWTASADGDEQSKGSDVNMDQDEINEVVRKVKAKAKKTQEDESKMKTKKKDRRLHHWTLMTELQVCEEQPLRLAQQSTENFPRRQRKRKKRKMLERNGRPGRPKPGQRKKNVNVILCLDGLPVSFLAASWNAVRRRKTRTRWTALPEPLTSSSLPTSSADTDPGQWLRWMSRTN